MKNLQPTRRHARLAIAAGASALLALALAGCTSGGTAASACAILADPVNSVSGHITDAGGAVSEFDFAAANASTAEAVEVLAAAEEKIGALGGTDAGYLSVVDASGTALDTLDALAATFLEIHEAGLAAELSAAAIGTPIEGADVDAQLAAAAAITEDTGAVQDAFNALSDVCSAA